MWMDTLNFDALDVGRMAIQQIAAAERAERFPAFKAVAFNSVVKSIPKPRKTLSPVAKWVGTYISRYIGSKAAFIEERVVWFDGAAVRLRSEIAAVGMLPQEDLVARIESFQAINEKAKTHCQAAAVSLEKRNSLSRPAKAFRRLVRALSEMEQSIATLRNIAVGEDWETSVALQRASFNNLRGLIRSGETADIDDDLLALAGQALASSNARDLHADAEWPRRLAESPLH
jgi:hypothetical protein